MTDSFTDHVDDKTQGVSVTVNEDGSIVIGDRTFDNSDALAKSWANGQAHIQTIEGENATLRQGAAKAKTIDEVMEELSKRQKATQNDDATPPSSDADDDDSKSFLTEEDLDVLVDKRLDERDLARKTQANKQKAMNMAKEALGDDALSSLQNRAKELGMTEAEALTIAGKSPDAFAKLFLPENPTGTQRKSGDINTGAVFGQRKEERKSSRVPIGASASQIQEAWNNAAPTNEE